MPKKTKKQKIIAQYHKKLKLIQSRVAPPEIIEDGQKKAKVDTEDKNDYLPNEFNLLKNDFKKSLFLTVLIIALEFLFYFATINNYLKLR